MPTRENLLRKSSSATANDYTCELALSRWPRRFLISGAHLTLLTLLA
jgi:hypothetical protein